MTGLFSHLVARGRGTAESALPRLPARFEGRATTAGEGVIRERLGETSPVARPAAMTPTPPPSVSTPTPRPAPARPASAEPRPAARPAVARPPVAPPVPTSFAAPATLPLARSQRRPIAPAPGADGLFEDPVASPPADRPPLSRPRNRETQPAPAPPRVASEPVPRRSGEPASSPTKPVARPATATGRSADPARRPVAEPRSTAIDKIREAPPAAAASHQESIDNPRPEAASMPPSIEVRIGRIEVRAVSPRPIAAAPPKRSAPPLSLNDYLAQRRRGA